MGVVWTFLLSSILSFLFLHLSGRRPGIDCNIVSKGRKEKTANQPIKHCYDFRYKRSYHFYMGWSGDAMMLGKIPVPGRPSNLGGGRVERRCLVNFQCRGVLLVCMIVGQGPIALAVGAGGGLDIFSLIYLFSFFLPLFGRRPDID